ncbi:MAG TPA: ferritin family protein [Mesotoga sp.]|jgi:rubrerythrin|nr:ferritin family protein [Mesotoga sp.]MDI9374665.1 ferritin family protein [Thermotogota bacterium]NLX32696.1 ferritin family protein [Thermotogaceae bacterium]MDD4039683.1 ferritin family protein [Mesotoga sp.]MDD4479143.1 ferritin family protein [Mesotoga sp.]
MLTVNDMLSIALKIEGAGYSYYSKLAEKTTGKIKELFSHLADQERDHASRFREMLKDIENLPVTAEWEDNVGYLKSYAEISIFPKIESEEVPQNLNKAISAAMEVEKDSIIFYGDLETFIPNSESLKKIIAEEKRHLIDLVKLYGTV